MRNITTIAYKNGVLACDSCWNDKKLITTSLTKIERLTSGALFGAAGDDDIRPLMPLIDRVKSSERLPMRSDLRALRIDFKAILVLPRGEVFVLESGPGGKEEDDFQHFDAGLYPANRGCIAIGTGGEIAIGAMAAGRSAAEAVAIACRWDTDTRLPVHQLELKSPLRRGSKS